jgi:AraC family transcriptional regulator, activator of mtrCDE
MDWLSRLFDMMAVTGRLDLRCSYGAPWRIEQGPAPEGEIPYHVIVKGSAILEEPSAKRPLKLKAGDILLLPRNPRHVLRDGGDAPPVPAQNHLSLNFIISENASTGERLDMLCGHFIVALPQNRLLLKDLPPRLLVHTSDQDTAPSRSQAVSELGGLVTLIRGEAAADRLGGRAVLNALSTALFALALRLASEAGSASEGLLALAGHPRLAPALSALFNEPGRSWSLPELAQLSDMSRATFARQFQEALGRSASSLLNDIRMTLAARELKKPSMSTGTVAEAVGYRSEAAFQRAFKSHMGMTPGHWRKAHSEFPRR